MTTELQEFVNSLLIQGYSEIVFDIEDDLRIETRNLKADSLVIENSKKLKVINIKGNILASKLKSVSFKNCPELEMIILQNHEITDVGITRCPKLEIVNLFNNKLSNINRLLDQLNPEIMTKIWLNNNKFDSTLVPFEKFIKLEKLGLADNEFRGSLEPLNKLRNLKALVFNQTHIDSGLEFLDMELKHLHCGFDDTEFGVLKIQDQLKKYVGLVNEMSADQLPLLHKWRIDYLNN